jgi:hypothetical protein
LAQLVKFKKMKTKVLLLLLPLLLIGCGTWHIVTDDVITSTKVLYRAPYNGYYTALDQTLTNLNVPATIKYVTVYVGFDVWSNGGAYGSFDIYLADSMLETKAPSYGVNTIHRTGDIKTGTYYYSVIPVYKPAAEDTGGDYLLDLKVNQCAWHDGATWNSKIDHRDYGITKIIGHY